MSIAAKTLRHRSLALSMIIGALCQVSASHAGTLSELREALADSKPLADLRVRTESVDQVPFAEESEVTTVRARLGFETSRLLSTALLVEAEAVWPVAGNYRPDNSRATQLTHPVIADPEGYEINRLQLSNTRLPGTTLTLGRQRINLDDQRFVGGVAWRQNEQTFDALRIVNKSVPKLTVDFTYFNQVNRIFGPESPQGRFEGDSFLGNVSYQLPLGKLTGFAYILDFDPLAPIAGLTAAQFNAIEPLRMSSATYGFRMAGERVLNKAFKLSYVASYAQQKDQGHNPLDYSLDYRLLEATAGWRQYSVGVGQELLEGNGTAGFSAPLGTLHKFQGWADKFLLTPGNGMDDRYVSVGYQGNKIGRFDSLGLSAVYHMYQNDRTTTDLGNELDVQVQAKWKRLAFMLKYASYSAQRGETPAIYRDTNKYWAQVEFTW